MPANPATVTVSTEEAAPRDAQSGLCIVIGHDSSYGTANSPKKYFDAKALQTDHGSATKTGKAGALLFKNKAASVVVIKPTVTAVASETFGTQAGTLANFPVSGTTAPTVTVNGVAATVVYKTETGAAFTALTPGAGNVNLNPYTGEFEAGDAAGTGVVWNYSYIDYDAMVDALHANLADLGPYELLVLPGQDVKKATYGDFKGLCDVAEDNDWFLIGALPASETVANAKAMRSALASTNCAIYAHKDTTNDVAAIVAGMTGKTDPHVTTAYKRLLGLDMTSYYLPSDIGNVETADTFEGEGINVIHRLGNRLVPSNERTTATYATETKIYVSRVRTELSLKAKLKAEFTSTLLDNPKVGFDQKGLAAGSMACKKVLEGMVADGAIFGQGEADADLRYVVTDPVIGSITTANKKKRSLGPWRVKVVMVESAHEITADVTLVVG